MELLRTILTLALGAILWNGCSDFLLKIPTGEAVQSLDNLPAFNPRDHFNNSPEKKDSLIGLMVDEATKKKLKRDGVFCTAFIISDKLAITAAHCLVNENDFMTREEIRITDSRGNPLDLKVRAGAVNLRADLGVLIGDFQDLNKFAVDESGFLGGLSQHHPFVSCGFGWGQTPAICVPFIPVGTMDFTIAGSSALLPGMSGGPVVDMESGAAVGINHGVYGERALAVPTLGLLGALGLKSE